MLSKQRQQDYFSNRVESVLHNYEVFSKHTRAQNIHKIRVDLKKIRALLYLQKKTGGKPDQHATRYVDKLFRQAGKIRDAQMSAALVKKIHSGTTHFFARQRDIVAEESKIFHAMVSRHVDKLLVASSQQWKSFRDIPDRKIAGLDKSIVKKLKPVFIPKLIQRELHDSRKIIKRLIYINSILKANNGSRINTDFFRKLEESVGKWHDAVVTEKLLRQHSPGKNISRLLAAEKKKSLAQAQLIARKCFPNK